VLQKELVVGEAEQRASLRTLVGPLLNRLWDFEGANGNLSHEELVEDTTAVTGYDDAHCAPSVVLDADRFDDGRQDTAADL
jgi:hypothetical protein